MPLVLDGRSIDRKGRGSERLPTPDRSAALSAPLDIGLVNNMPDAAFRATERQFVRVLAAAAGPLTIRLHLFALPEIPRGPAAQAYMRREYRMIDELARTRLDALIVTGAEPRAASLFDEPYWGSLTGVVDWAEHNTVSTIWSCLAAHAAVLHLDGIGRHRLPQKRFGLFECVKAADHPVLAGMQSVLRVPHSRWNDLREADLRANGYRILTRSFEAGIDMFTKQWRSTFLFLQGHPEYEPDTLFREYRRDAQRFLRRERDDFPRAPAHYLDPKSESAMQAFAARGRAAREPETFAEFPAEWALRTPLVDVWRDSALQLYRNWLRDLATVRG